MLNTLPKVRSLPSSLAINLMKMEIEIFQKSRDLTLSKGHVWEPLTLSQYLAYYGVDTSSAGRDMRFICHVIPQDDYVEMSCVFMGESFLQHVTTLESLVIIGILIVKRKNASSKIRIL